MYSYGGLLMIGEIVRERRMAMRLTQVQLGERAGLTQDYISKLERGTIDMPQKGTLQVLGRVLKVPLADFYRAAGVLEPEVEPRPRQLALLSLRGDEEYTAEEIVAHVESRPGRQFREDLRQARAERDYDEYVEFCLDIFRAWESNSDLGIKSLRRSRTIGTGGR